MRGTLSFSLLFLVQKRTEGENLERHLAKNRYNTKTISVTFFMGGTSSLFCPFFVEEKNKR